MHDEPARLRFPQLNIISQGSLALCEKDDASSMPPKQASVAQATKACLGMRTVAVGLAGALGYAGWAWQAGQDANWDLQNYHDYAAYALIHWRYPLDVGPGGFQGYLNPLPYLIPYALRHNLPPLPAGVALAASQSAIVVVVWCLAGRLLPGDARWRGFIRCLAAFVGSTGAMMLSEVGTSFADLQLAAVVLGGLSLSLPDGRRAWPFLSGVLIGLATGLKLTNAVFGLGLVASLTVRPWLAGRPMRAAVRAVAGLAAGFAMTGGAWAAFLWTSFANPVFPALNTLFRSPSAAFSDYADLRFRPAGWVDGLTYPFQIAAGLHPTAEAPFAEPRLLLAALAAAAVAVTARFRQGPPGASLLPAFAFLGVSMTVWLAIFAIERYAVAIEALSGVLLIVAMPRILPGVWGAAAALALTVGVVGATRPADWWRHPWPNAYIAAPPPALLLPAAFAIVAHPNGYWASALPEGSRFYTVLSSMGLATGGALARQLAEGLANPPNGVVWTLGYDVPMDEAARAGLAGQGLVPAVPCYRARSLWWVDTIACRVARVGRRPRAAADLVLDVAVDFTSQGSGWVYLGKGWRNAGPTGTALDGGTSELVLWTMQTGSPLVLDLTIGLAGSGPERRVHAAVDGAVATSWTATTAAQTEHVCLPVPGMATIILDQTPTATAPGPAGAELRSMRLRRTQPGECVR